MKLLATMLDTEAQRYLERYARRSPERDHRLYDPLNPAVLMGVQERERALCKWLWKWRHGPVSELRLLEIGCGSGRTLADFLRLGFSPGNIVGNDLIQSRLEVASVAVPRDVRLLCGDALDLPFEKESFDVVVQSTVFTSLMDTAFQNKLARKMWALAAPGGGVLWYDFVYSNPSNPDVRGISYARVRQLFPEAHSICRWRLTLAPPISRIVTRVHPACYTLFNCLPVLRTHMLCWLEKS